jgi:hypothetical protein
MSKQPTLRPSDVVVACQLALTPSAQFKELAKSTGISTGECHNAVRRLRFARLILPEKRQIAVDLLSQFLIHGAPFAFPPVLGQAIVGIPTAHASPAFEAVATTTDPIVWPAADGAVRGRSLVPLFPGAPELPRKNVRLYELLTLVDALRTGTARVRTLAADLLATRLNAGKQ